MTYPVPRLWSGNGGAWLGPVTALQQRFYLDPAELELAANAALSSEAHLIHAGLAPSVLDWMERLARQWGVSVRDVALSLGTVEPKGYLRALSAACGIEMADPDWPFKLQPITPFVAPYRLLQGRQPLPLAGYPPRAVLNAQNFTPEALVLLSNELGPARDRLCLTDKASLGKAIAETYGGALADEAANGLNRRLPRFSAATPVSRWQILCLILIAGLFAGMASFMPREAVALYGGALSLMFLLSISIRITAAGHALYRRLWRSRTAAPLLADRDLPRYTVLVAMYREARVLPDLVSNLMALDYPAAKLDIKLVLEADDAETIAAARALTLPPHIEIVIVPDGTPRTKPRALNYALQFACGELLVIYDAEDRPRRDQLRKAASHFHLASPDVACLQARLTFDNSGENWLAKQFTIEYASLFGGILPMLDAVRLPIPLGGTSNHFRIDVLRRIGGWDAYNVTEDADLGMRLYRRGLRVEMLDSVTYEEAACHTGNWLRQRTRWLKGWMQTYGVHMRQPARLLRELGPAGFLTFQGQFAGVMIAALVHPLSYVILIHDVATGLIFEPSQTWLGQNLWLIAAFNLIAGYLASLALGLFVLTGRRVRGLVPQLFLIPVYWLFISAAAYRAVYQLITAPYYWEKTEHGVTAVKRRKRR